MLTVAGYAALVALTCVAVEAFAFLALVTIDVRRGRTFGLALKNRLREHPWNSVRFATSMSDPINITRLDCHASRGNGRSVNVFGFFDNGEPTSPFPDKPPGTYRIVFFGGSSGEGVGLSAPETITAQLEKRLNQDGRLGRVQVLNFATSGASTWTTVTTYLSEVTYYRPDAVIMLDGWNDVVNACMEHRRRGINNPILNWPMAAYEHFDYWHNLPTQVISGSGAPRLMTWTYVLIDRWLPKPPRGKRIEEAYRQHPVYNFTRGVVARDPSLAAAFASNVEAVGAHASANGRLFIAYLQPSAIFAKPLLEEENQILDNFCANMERDFPGCGWDRENVEQTFAAALEDYAGEFRRLRSLHVADPRFLVFDIRRLFADHAETLYQNVIHYNASGAALLAARMAKDILAGADERERLPAEASSPRRADQWPVPGVRVDADQPGLDLLAGPARPLELGD